MKKFLVITFALFFVLLGYVESTSATIGGKCAPKCSYGCDCGKDCKGKGCTYDAKGNECCPFCFAPSCEEEGMSSSCPAGCDCETKRIACDCGNSGGKTCYVCGDRKRPPKPPGPSEPPPKPTAPPATPTPIQPTIIKNIPLPDSDAFDEDGVLGVTSDSFNEAGKYWICLDSKPCSDPASGCSGNGNKAHRVKVETKKDTKLKLPNTPTYVLECVSESAEQKQYQCTTGDMELDNKLLTRGSHLKDLQDKYGYAFTSYTDMGGNAINQKDESRVPKTTQEGLFGPYEWESYTRVNAWRMIMSMQYANGAGDDAGNLGALQQASTTFIFDKANKDCVIIQWDPRGVVYDVDTGEPISGVVVTLFVKNDKDVFEKMNDPWGMIANPVSTTKKGKYQFLVSPGTYKLQVTKDGYEMATETKHNIPHLYDGGEIITENEVKEVNVGMKKIRTPSVFDSVFQLFHIQK